MYQREELHMEDVELNYYCNQSIKDPIINTILKARYEREKELNELEKQLTNLGYSILEIKKNAVELFRQNKQNNYRSKISSTYGNYEYNCDEKKRLDKQLADLLKSKKKIKTLVVCTEIVLILLLLLIIGSIIVTANLAILYLPLFDIGIICGVFVVYRKEITYAQKDIEKEIGKYEQKIKEFQKVREESLFKQYCKVFSDYFIERFNHPNLQYPLYIQKMQAKKTDYYMMDEIDLQRKINEEQKTLNKQLLLQKYREIVESMNPINEIEEKNMCEKYMYKTYKLKR